MAKIRWIEEKIIVGNITAILIARFADEFGRIAINRPTTFTERRENNPGIIPFQSGIHVFF